MVTFPLQYGLRLAQGDSWSLFFSHDLISWGREFVNILGLKADPKKHRNKIFFCSGQEARFEGEIVNAFSGREIDGYAVSSISFPGLEIQYHLGTSSYFCTTLVPDEENNRIRYTSMISALFPLYQESIACGGLPLHAALLHHPNIGGIAILAPGGTGKSTCTQNAPSPWVSYCDDLILVVKDAQFMYYAHAFPTWSNFLLDRSRKPIWSIERYTGLQGLFFLQKADHDEIIPLLQLDAVQWIYESSMQIYQEFIIYLSKEDQLKQKTQAFSNACNLARQCPSFILKAVHHGYFWEEIEKLFHKEDDKYQPKMEQL